MNSQTAALLVGPATGADFMGVTTGVHPLHQFAMHEGSRPVWICNEPVRMEAGKERWAFVPTDNPLQDAFAMIAARLVEIPSVRAALREIVGDVDADWIDLPHNDKRMQAVYDLVKEELVTVHVGISLFAGSYASVDLDSLADYSFDVEVLRPTFQRIRLEGERTWGFGTLEHTGALPADPAG